MTKSDPNRLVPYALRWPAWLSEKAAEAATARAMSVAGYIREAVVEKLERDSKQGVAECPIQAVFSDGYLSCTLPRGHAPGHSWERPGTDLTLTPWSSGGKEAGQ